jgi:hypothetical protein
MVGIFDAAVVGGCAQLKILSDAVEFEQPVLEAGSGGVFFKAPGINFLLSPE